MISRRIIPVSRGKGLLCSRFYSNVKFPEHNINHSKPKISEFKNPLFHAFLIASTTYILLHTIWITLEYEETKKQLSEKNTQLETRIRSLVDEKKNELESKQKSCYSRINFWK